MLVKGTTQGTITTADGTYSLLNIPPNATLVFSFVGMRTQEVAVAGKTSVNVSMEEETIDIEEVVTVGYGVQRKVTLTGSIVTVDSKLLENRPITNSSQAMQGILSLSVNQAAGLRHRGTHVAGGAFHHDHPRRLENDLVLRI